MKFILNGEVVSYSRYRIMMDIFGNEQAIRNLDKFKDLLKIDVEFDGKPIDALVVDMSGENPIVQLMIPRKCKFDSLTNKWKNSSIRKILNSDEFIWLFNEEFSKIVRPTVVHTENYTTTDTFWFLSHEEIGYDDKNKWFNPNLNTRKFDAFDGTKQSRIRKVAQCILVATAMWPVSTMDVQCTIQQLMTIFCVCRFAQSDSLKSIIRN